MFFWKVPESESESEYERSQREEAEYEFMISNPAEERRHREEEMSEFRRNFKFDKYFFLLLYFRVSYICCVFSLGLYVGGFSPVGNIPVWVWIVLTPGLIMEITRRLLGVK